MLTSAFNERAEHQKETDFNYAMSGGAEKIGRIATNAAQDYRSERYIQKQREKHNRHLREITHMQELMASIDAGFERMNDILDKMEENSAQLNTITDLLNAGDMDAARDYISSVTGEDASKMTDEQAQEWLIDKGYEHINNIDDLTEEYKNEVKEQLKRIGELPEGSPERRAAEKTLENLENKFEKVAELNKLKGDFYKALKSVDGIDGYDISAEGKAEYDQSNNNTQTKNRTNLTEDTSEIANGNKELIEKPSYESAFPEMDGVLTDSFNAASSGEDALESDLETSLDERVEPTTQPLKAPDFN